MPDPSQRPAQERLGSRLGLRLAQRCALLLLPLLARLAARWVRGQQAKYLPAARPLTDTERAALDDWFDDALLDRVRIHTVDRIPGPGFLRPFQALGIVRLDLDFADAAGITFGDLVLLARAPRSAPRHHDLLCHETVHVRQYAEHGLEGFLRGYLAGWIETGFSYYDIPFEKEAYAFEARYRQARREG